MTIKTDKGWKILYPGNSTSDNLWGCDTGYYEYNNSGIIQCLEDGDHITNETDLMTTDSKQTTETVTDSSPTPSDGNNLVVGIVCGVVFFLLISLISLLYCYWKKLYCFSSREKHSSKLDFKEDNDSSGVEVPMIATPNNSEINTHKSASLEMNELLDDIKSERNNYISNGNSKENIGSTSKNIINLEQQLHAEDDKNTEQKPIRNNHGISLGDKKLDVNYSNEKKKVNEAFKRMCYNLCFQLGKDGDYILNVLNLQSNDQNKRYEEKFIDSLSKWSEDFPFNEFEDGLWLPLSKLKDLVKDKNRMDIVNIFEDLTKDVMKNIYAFNKIKQTN